MKPAELDAQELVFQKEFYMLQLFQFSSSPLSQPLPAPSCTLQMEPEHLGVRLLSRNRRTGKALTPWYSFSSSLADRLEAFGESQTFSMTMLHFDGVNQSTYLFKMVQPLP